MIPFDARGVFCPVSDDGELRRSAIRGAGATITVSAASFAIQFASTPVLARLLTPTDFGIVTMVTTFSLAFVSVGLNGFTEAVIQAENIDHYTASNIFWLNLVAGLTLTGIFIATGPLLAQFYRNPLVADTARGLSIVVVASSVSVVHLALLKRAMRFAATSSNDVLGRLIYTIISILLALRGWAYWALVVGLVAQQLSITMGAWWLCRWVPGLPRATGKTRTMLSFALKVYGQSLVRYSTQNADNLLIASRFNAVAVGAYKRAYDLFALSASQLVAPLFNVGLVTLSKLNNDRDRFRRCLVSSLSILAFIAMAISADLTLVGKDVVLLVLGPQWSDSARIFQLFAPGIGVMLLYGTVSWIHLAIGEAGRLLRWTIVELSLTISLFVLSLHWGPAGVAGAWSISYWILLIPAFWYAGRPIGFGVSDLIFPIWKFVIAAITGGFATAEIVRTSGYTAVPAGAGTAVAVIIATSTVFILIYAALIILLHGSLAPLQQLGVILNELLPAGKRMRPAVEPVAEYK